MTVRPGSLPFVHCWCYNNHAYVQSWHSSGLWQAVLPAANHLVWLMSLFCVLIHATDETMISVAVYLL